MAERSIEIVGWDRFQHYKDRWPPWIKTYTDLLANEDYLSLSGHRRSVLHGLWLAYAMSHGRLTVDTLSLSRRLSLRVTMADLEALNHAGFIRFGASTPIALTRSQEAEEKEQTEDLRPEGSNASDTPPNPIARPVARTGFLTPEPERNGLAPLDYLAQLEHAEAE